jgi:hypothetical protein
MTGRDAINLTGVLAILGLLLTAAVQVQTQHERAYALPESGDDSLYLTSGRALRHMTVSQNALAADIYWIRALQYYGGTKRRLAEARFVPPPPPAIAASSAYDQLYPMLDVTTSLDPRFKIAYRFGAVFLAEPFPNGAGRPDLAVKLLEKGLREEPDKWQYMQDIGFVHYWYDHDYRAAAAAFLKASEIPGAPWWLRSLAATTLAEGGDRRSSRTMWTSIRDSAEIDWLRNDAIRRLAQLDALDQMDELQRLVDRYGAQTGQPPADWLSLVRAGLIRGVPLDPARTRYEITAEGRVRMAAASPLWPLPLEPERLAPKPAS